MDLKCDRCDNTLIVEDVLTDGSFIASCPSCDMPTPPEYVYINHCWKCGGNIDSRNCMKSLIPNMGYHCKSCGEDLTNYFN
jgi:hypothetical protein